MALIFNRVDIEPTTPPSAKGFSWDAWYAQNKQRLSEKRAKRYREDPGYREAALKRSRDQRKSKKTVAPDDAYTVAFNDAAQDVGVTVWVLREWRRKDYFPEPHRRGGRLWFTSSQVFLLQKIKQLFDQHGTRVSDSFRPDLDALVQFVYSNWS